MPTKTPPMHPKPKRGLKSPFMPVNDSDTAILPPSADAAGAPVRRANAGAHKSGGTGPKQ